MTNCYYLYIIIFLLILHNYQYVKEYFSPINKILAYLSKPSYYIDEEIELKISSIFNICNLQIFNIHPSTNKIRHISIDDYKIIYEKKGIKTKQQSTPAYSFAEGCNWTTTYSFKLNQNLKSDMYIIKLYNGLTIHYLILLIKNRTPSAKNIVLMNTNTWQAYNNFDGASLYTYTSPHKKYFLDTNRPSTQVSYQRPFPKQSSMILNYIQLGQKYKGLHIVYSELIFLKWCKLNNIQYDITTDYDL